MSKISVGVVDGINENDGTIRVMFPDHDNEVLDEIALFRTEQWFPQLEESVVCIFISNNSQQGFCIGPYFNDEDLPYIPNRNKYVKKLDEGLVIEYDFTSKNLTINATTPVTINGDVNINGNLNVSGIIT